MAKAQSAVWRIELAGAPGASRFLMRSADGVTSWTAAEDAALRFPTKGEADRYARNHVAGDVVVRRPAWA